MSDFSAFAKMERSGWSDAARAEAYVGLFASASEQAIGRLLDAAAARSGVRVRPRFPPVRQARLLTATAPGN